MQLSQDAQYHTQKFQEPKYWDMLSVDNGTDMVVRELMKVLPSWSEVFEYASGRWRNAIPLSEKWHHVIAQDIVQQLVSDLIETAKTKHLSIETLVWDAREIAHHRSYDALVIVRMIHFLQEADAISVIQKMKTHTKVGGYNACVIFSQDPTKDNGFYFPTREEFLEQYVWWKIIFEDAKMVKMVEWAEMPRFSMLLQRVA
jgi:2-polyprenyl-3-methyl-5-hydroxy-6-metoxy-1,4-benzoquinol methylase